MIRNIVFDMGNTVIVFDPEYFMDVEGISDTDDRKLVYCELFHSVEWAQMDLGVLTEETAEQPAEEAEAPVAEVIEMNLNATVLTGSFIEDLGGDGLVPAKF